MDDELELALSQLESAQNSINNPVISEVAQQPWSPELIKFLTMGIFAFSCFALVMATILMWRSNAQATQVLRVIGVILIVTFSATLLVVGYGNEQLTPIIGLFGAIAGYLLGKDSKTE